MTLKNQNKLPIAVCTGDVHFSLKNLSEATITIEQGKKISKQLEVPFLINGDLTDGKAIIRGEVANRLVELCNDKNIIINIGNHDLINEKTNQHSLNFLKAYCTVIDKPTFVERLNGYIIPYHSDQNKLRAVLSSIPKNFLIFMHQGLKTCFMGEYSIDSSSIDPEELKDFRVILSHYHRAQDVGTCSFIGSPYSITFSEANDPPKGLKILYNDGSLELYPLNLRKHVIIERSIEEVMNPINGLNSNDLLWLKVSGPSIELDKLSKKKIGEAIQHKNFKLDKISTDTPKQLLNVEKLSKEQLVDYMIDKENINNDKKDYLKNLWRLLVK